MILPVNIKYTRSNANLPKKSVNFSASIAEYTVKTQFSTKTISNFTKLFRCDMDWQNLVSYLSKHFKDKSKVNIINCASSDGSEPYSLSIALKSALGAKSKKFFPILASDKNDKIISRAKRGKIEMFDDDVKRTKEICGNVSKYFYRVKDEVPLEIRRVYRDLSCHTYEATPELKRSVRFEKSSIGEQLQNLNDNGNTFILCRNVFPYLSEYDQFYAVKYLKEKLKPGSVVAIGNYDDNVNTSQNLLKSGFKKIAENLFECT